MSDDPKDFERLEARVEYAHNRIDDLWKVLRQLRHDIVGAGSKDIVAKLDAALRRNDGAA
jgi:hypothetical protein